MNYHHALEVNNSVSNKRVQQLYSQDQLQEVIDQAERQASSARQTLENIQRVDEARLSRNSPKCPRTPQATERHKYARDNTWVTYRELHKQITQPVQVLSSWDPCLIAKIPSNPRSIPYHSSDSIPTILWDSDTMLTKTPNSEYPPSPPTHYYRSLNSKWSWRTPITFLSSFVFIILF